MQKEDSRERGELMIVDARSSHFIRDFIREPGLVERQVGDPA